jgi:hypothetical protein
MRTVELLAQGIELLKGRGYGIREEWLEGRAGACEIRGRKWLFIDLAMSPDEQLELVLETLEGDRPPGHEAWPDEAHRLRCLRRAA